VAAFGYRPGNQLRIARVAHPSHDGAMSMLIQRRSEPQVAHAVAYLAISVSVRFPAPAGANRHNRTVLVDQIPSTRPSTRMSRSASSNHDEGRLPARSVKAVCDWSRLAARIARPT